MNRKEILRRAKNRMISGNKKHGKFNPKTDTRDLFSEIQEEILDCINYNVMEYLKIEELKKRKEDI